jgi:hypothetical protein
VSERIDLLQPLITPAVEKLAHRRILSGEPLVTPAGEVTGKRADVKIALILVHILNPYEVLRKEEEALLRGVSSDTLNRRANELRKL